MLASAVASDSGVIVVSMADHRANIDIVGPRPWFFNAVGRSEPDLRLLKQVEQVTTLITEGSARRFAAIRTKGRTAASWQYVF